jgi:hypothetical protein
MHDDGLPRRPAFLEDPRRLRVQRRPLPRRQPAQHGVPDERVLELERTRVPEDPGAHELLGERGRVACLGAGQSRGRDQRRGVEDGHRAGEPRGTLAESGERRADRVRHGVRPDARHLRGVVDRAIAERVVRRGAGRAPRHEQQRGHRIEAVGEEREEPDRGRVGPVQVVDDEQLRALGREGRDEPVQAVQDPEVGRTSM